MNKLRKLFLIICVTFIFVVSMYFSFYYKEIVFVSEENVNNSMFAIMIEDGNGTGSYIEYIDSDICPGDGYIYNSDKSYCVNGSELIWDNTEKKVTTSVLGSEKCYLYFDANFTLVSEILKNNGGADAISAKEAHSYGVIATTNEGMYATLDNDGTTYYFRGAVDNNYVYFANLYWRIVRINGDGSVRLIYQGAISDAVGTNSILSNLSVFNSSHDSSSFVGFMFTDGYYHGNDNSSVIKGVLDDWYISNLSTYSEFFDVNAGFCADRNNVQVNTSDPYLGEYYSAYSRLYEDDEPDFKCADQRDLFTSVNSTKGNKVLTNPIGLITGDEVYFAGAIYGEVNENYYLNSGVNYWTMTPNRYLLVIDPEGNSTAREFVVSDTGVLGNAAVTATSYGIRPVINLKGDLRVSGTGLWNTPYQIIGGL